MNAQSYTQWCDLAGLYLENVSHADRYKTYAEKLSLAGVTTIIVHDFLSDNSPAIDVSHWRTISVYEIGSDQQQRIKMTVTALELIGASRVALAVREAKSLSPFAMFQDLELNDPMAFQEAMKKVNGLDLRKHLQESVDQAFPEMAKQAGNPTKSSKSTTPSSEHESREQIEYLLQRYTEEHAAELQADIDQYGDPRTLPGFTVKGRMQELDELRQREIAIKRQQEEIKSFRELMAKIVKETAKTDKPARRTTANLRKLRRDFLELIKENRRWKADNLLPETISIREDANAFMTSHSNVFQQDYIGNASLTARANAIGPFVGDVCDGNTELSWESPQGLTCNWTTFSLLLEYPKKQNKTLKMLLGTAERLQRHWKTASEQWRQEIIACFRDNYLNQMDEWELEDYELDESDEPTDTSILAHVEGATIILSVDDENGEDIHCSTFFNVAWDVEHGFDLEWEDEPDGIESREESRFSLGKVQLVNCGRKLEPADLKQFESRLGIKLPPRVSPVPASIQRWRASAWACRNQARFPPAWRHRTVSVVIRY